MKTTNLSADLESALTSFNWMDAHTHVDAGHLAARGLDDILLYHMSISDLYAAGCPSGARLSDDRTTEEAHQRLAEAVPFLPKVRNTFIAWGARTILADLYDWREPVTESNWRKLDALIIERAADPAWAREIVRRAGLEKIGTELWRGRGGIADDLLDYSLEWAFFSRTQWGQPDIPLYELERTWACTEAGVPIPVTFNRASAPPLEKTIKTVDDVREAVTHYCALIPYGRVLMTATHISTDIDYALPSDPAQADAPMASALKNRAQATDRDRDVYAAYITRLFLAELEKHGDQIAFEFSLGAEPLPFESSSRLSQKTIAQLAEMIAMYPKLRFICFVSSRHANQSLCTLARELPNFSLAAYWWHNFFPGAIRQVMEERLDMVPVNKQIGFFSDAYCVDWAYAKAKLVRKLMAEVFAGKIEIGQYSFEEAVSIAKAILYDSARELTGVQA